MARSMVGRWSFLSQCDEALASYLQPTSRHALPVAVRPLDDVLGEACSANGEEGEGTRRFGLWECWDVPRGLQQDRTFSETAKFFAFLHQPRKPFHLQTHHITKGCLRRCGLDGHGREEERGALRGLSGLWWPLGRPTTSHPEA